MRAIVGQPPRGFTVDNREDKFYRTMHYFAGALWARQLAVPAIEALVAVLDGAEALAAARRTAGSPLIGTLATKGTSAVSIIKNAIRPVVERSRHTGEVATPIGAVETEQGGINIWVTGTVVDVNLVSRLEEAERADAAHTALHDGVVHAHIDLDDAHAEGLVELLRQALDVRTAGLATTDDEGVSGTLPA